MSNDERLPLFKRRGEAAFDFDSAGLGRCGHELAGELDSEQAIYTYFDNPDQHEYWAQQRVEAEMGRPTMSVTGPL